MNAIQETLDIDVPEAEQETGTGHAYYFLVKYDTEDGVWSIDDDSIYLPDVPLFDYSMQRFRTINADEIDTDTELRNQLRSVLEGVSHATP